MEESDENEVGSRDPGSDSTEAGPFQPPQPPQPPQPQLPPWAYGGPPPSWQAYWQQAHWQQRAPWNEQLPPEGGAPEPPKRRRPHMLGMVTLAIVIALALATVGGFVGHLIGEPSSPSSLGGQQNTPSSSSSSSDPSAIASRVSPGLVDINTVIDYGAAAGAATGMVLTPNGEVLTNNHVAEGATSIRVTDIGNGQTYSATVVGYDVSKDVAVLQLQGASNLQTVKIGDSSSVAVGAQVVAIGNAGGQGGTPSYAGGTVTAIGRSITAQDSITGTSEQLSNMIATDASVVSGDSGGPLVNSSGQVIGMDTAGSQSFQFAGPEAQSQGFAVPINDAMAVTRQIEAHQSSATVHVGPTAFLGVQVQPNGYASGVSGAVISGVLQNGPAASAGLAAGDIITSVGGTSVTSNNDLRTVLVQDKPGQSVQIVYLDQSGQQHTATVTLASGPAA